MSNIEFDKILKSIFEELHNTYNVYLQQEYMFSFRLHQRRFAADYAELKYGILIEYEGLQVKGSKSRHTTIDGYTRDCSKYNLGTTMGFSWLRYTRNHLDIDQIKQDLISTIETKHKSNGAGRCSNCNDKLFMPVNILDDNICLLCEFKNYTELKNKKKPKKAKIKDGLNNVKPVSPEKPARERRSLDKSLSLSLKERRVRQTIEGQNIVLLDDLFYSSPKDK